MTSAKQRTLLAVLLTEANRPVPSDRLADAAWGESPPAPATLRWHVHHVRQALGGDRLTRRPEGYLLTVHPGELDAERFERLCASAADLDDPARIAEVLGEALALWRGPAYADLADAAPVGIEASRLEELRLAAVERRALALLDLGRDGEATAELQPHLLAHPLRERLRELLMRALHQAGRRADALRLYRDGRELLAGELGIEPGGALRELHAEILREEPPPVSVRPAQLPPDVFAFTGRQAELAVLDDLLESEGSARVAAVSGVGGVGKTGLAVRWAHRVAHRFPDGQLYADLGGRDPGEVLERFLAALGVMRVPEGLDQRAALYRGLASSRRLLVLLDNAADSAQVGPLLPASPCCFAVVTGRSRFEGLVAGVGARPVPLEVLSSGQAATLLGRVARVDPDEALALAELCDRLPLALRIAGARLVTRPGWTPRRLADRLEQERRRLDELRAGELDVRASFEVSHRDLPAPERVLFELLGLVEAPDFAPWTAAALMDLPLAEAAELMEQLAEAQLVQQLGFDEAGQERYRFHDLVRIFARERALESMARAEREAALDRVLGCLLALGEEAYLREYAGGFRLARGDAPRWRLQGEVLPAHPMGWLAAERATLMAWVRQAAAMGRVAACWDLALFSVRLYELTGNMSDWRESSTIALELCREHGDSYGAAVMLVSLGSLELFEKRYEPARDLLVQALPEIEGPYRALTLGNLGLTERALGAAETALSHMTEAREIALHEGDRATESLMLSHMAAVHHEAGRRDTAQAILGWAATVAEGIRRPQAVIRFIAARMANDRGEYERAERLSAEVLAELATIGDRRLEPSVMAVRARSMRGQGRIEEAAACARDALAMARALGDANAEQEYARLLDSLSGEPVGQADLT
ncbi:AfsR/SARP family transcriptional regulator [Nonomuraea dietziae]|uniref:DNA-binding SARP family transcriptional activator/tetratricopeptide (TPR) repeat protein n=1 Tax=Nonomuraea dietziae TaxID=65515 RepID=A0A7W5V0D6_9ACTN|nr:AfsR/SARP family transcriptional regulator [Nonomuraea dietziae]MBB3728086.1 DNA-binding SARP family transcriptional activator/tetratricopeptide (TPR) repeat protein [Nonomuraea dietziae]